MITKDQLEQLCLTWFQSIGYDTACGYDIAPDGDSPERSDYRQIVLFDRLLAQLQKINPHTPLSVLESVSRQIAKPETPVLIKNNRAFHKLLLEGVKVEKQIRVTRLPKLLSGDLPLNRTPMNVEKLA